MKLAHFLSLFFLISCTHNVPTNPSGKEEIRVLENELGQLSVSHKKENCLVTISTQKGSGYFRIFGDLYENKPECDPLSPDLLPLISEGLDTLLTAENLGPEKEITLNIPSYSRRFIRDWGKIVKEHEFQHSELSHKVVEKLLLEENGFSSYNPLFKTIGLFPSHVDIEKLALYSPESAGVFTDDLKAMGFSKKNPLPVPLIIFLTVAPGETRK